MCLKTILKSIYFGPERGLVVFLLKVHMDLSSLQSVQPQVNVICEIFWHILLDSLSIESNSQKNHAVSTDFNPSVSNNPPTRKKKSTGSTGLIVGIVVPIGIASFLSVFAVYFFVQRRRRHQAFEEEGKERKPLIGYLFKVWRHLLVCLHCF